MTEFIKTAGPWDSEPDEAHWEAHGLSCRIYRCCKETSGHLCGYVGVPKSHPFYDRFYAELDDVGLDVHGGITFSGEMRYGLGLWWFGFDCAHSNDRSPIQCGRWRDAVGTYRDFRWVRRETERLAEQIAKFA